LPDKDVDDKDLELEQACIDRFKSGEKARGDHETTREYKHFIRGSERVCYKSLLLHDAHLQLYDSDEQAIYETQYGQATLATRKFSEGKARQAIR
ncbi:MAG: hypothetical protein GTO54_01255, partial [Nitrososphaeria archaeon]|nr:hypothetical protein [Nitrososphaeria archaeon]